MVTAPAQAHERHRRGLVLTGSPEETARAAAQLCARLDPTRVLWVGAPAPGSAGLSVAPRELAGLLGRGFDAVVIDAHAGLEADVLGPCHGFVVGGGALVLRLSPGLPQPDARLAAHPFTTADVGLRFERRARALLAPVTTPAPLVLEAAGPVGPVPIFAPPPPTPPGTAEQAALVATLLAELEAGRAHLALLADRGRGKSSALGLLLARLSPRRVALTALSREALAEVLRFAGAAPCTPVWVPLEELLAARASFDLIVIDEAAQVPVPVLEQLVVRHPEARFVFATTVHGYEGTGRGFALRFLAWLDRRAEVLRLGLREPIRWAAGCPLEALVNELLLLDAEPAPVAALSGPGPEHTGFEKLGNRDIDERTLRDVFGLLVHAHYRTTPGDLQRLLDAPNLGLHVARAGAGRVAAACLVAHEGGLPPDLCAAVAEGRVRLKAHALADALVAHLGRVEAGELRMVRSVRIATHPELRRKGLARGLVEHVHASHAPDLFGTLFGASPELIAFRRELGYQLVRVSASRGARTGEPSVMMLHPVGEAAHRLVASLREELAHELGAQLELLAADGLLLAPALLEELRRDLPRVTPRAAAEDEARLMAYIDGPRTFESVAASARPWIERHPERLTRLARGPRALVEARAVQRVSWDEAARRAHLGDAGQAMKAMRRAWRAMLG